MGDAGPLIHPRHKTTLCQNELRHGVCKFGKVCIFIHKEDPEYEMLKIQMRNHQSLRSFPEPKRTSDPVEPTTNEQSVQPKSLRSFPEPKRTSDPVEPTTNKQSFPRDQRAHLVYTWNTFDRSQGFSSLY